MTEVEFLDFVRKAVHRATDNIGRIGNLVCTQTEWTGEPTLREPEMRTALQQQADANGLRYGIEVPTRYLYRFSGKGWRRALTDFAILDCPNDPRTVLVELKEGQPARTPIGFEEDYPAISKDLHKLIAEPSSHGACILHICQAANSATLDSVLRKYTCAMKTAILHASDTISNYPDVRRDHLTDHQTWFLLLILVVHPRKNGLTGKSSQLFSGKWQDRTQTWEIAEENLIVNLL